MKTILFVCTANICRSPMAMALLRDRIGRMGLADQVAVASAGIWAQNGRAASREGISLLADREISLAEHRSQPMTAALLEQADIVLVMEEAHRRSLFYVAPHLLGKVFLLTEMAGEYDDVEDPYGGTNDDYRRTIATLDRLLDAGLPQILRRIGVKTPNVGR